MIPLDIPALHEGHYVSFSSLEFPHIVRGRPLWAYWKTSWLVLQTRTLISLTVLSFQIFERRARLAVCDFCDCSVEIKQLVCVLTRHNCFYLKRRSCWGKDKWGLSILCWPVFLVHCSFNCGDYEGRKKSTQILRFCKSQLLIFGSPSVKLVTCLLEIVWLEGKCWKVFFLIGRYFQLVRLQHARQPSIFFVNFLSGPCYLVCLEFTISPC